MTNKRYFFYRRSRRFAVLLLASMAVFDSVEAQTITDVSSLKIIHRQSFMAGKTEGTNGLKFPHEFLQSGQGMIQKQVNGETVKIQNTSTYRMTRYVKHGVAVPLYLTTSQSTSAATTHRTYQRWYNYDTELPLENNVTCDLSKGNFQVLKYMNGLVMGTGIKGGANDNNHYARFNFWGILPDGTKRMNIGADLSIYNDWSYQYETQNTAALAGDLTEPSLTLRHIYELVDAKVMADSLVKMTDDNWLEEHVIHFPRRSTMVFRNDNPDENLGSNFVPLNLELENYWFYTGDGNHTDANLQNLSSDNYVEITSELSNTGMNITGIGFRNAPNTNVNDVENSATLRRRLIRFKYDEVPANSRLTIMVRSKDPRNANRKYNVAKFTIIFDENSEVVPYTDVVPENGARHNRSTQSLRDFCNGADPVAHIDFDYPHNPSYSTPTKGTTHLNTTDPTANTAFTHSSALPIAFEKTSYAYSPISNQGRLYDYCVWGSYAIVDYINNSYNGSSGPGTLSPVRTITKDSLGTTNAGFLYIDASDMPGTVASVPFQGTMCMGTKLMCSGWMSSITNQDPGSVILKVIGKRADNTEKEIYAYCTGQIGKSYRPIGKGITTGSDLMWQQFYFEFFLNEPCVSYELRVENNCVSTSGGDYFLDDIWVFAQLPKVGPEMETPLCGGNLDVVQLETNFESILLSTGIPEATSHETATTSYLSFIYLDWDNFLLKFQQGLAGMGITVSGHDLQENINSGYYDVDTYRDIYHTAFDESILRTTLTEEEEQQGLERKVIFGNFQWSSYYNDQPEFSFAAMALDDQHTIYRMTDTNTGQRRLIFNGSMGIDQWEFYHNYALLTTLRSSAMTEAEAENSTWISDLLFNVLNECSNRSILWFAPKVEIVGTIGGISIEDLEFCEYTTQTFGMELTGYAKPKPENNENDPYPGYEPGELIILPEVYFDWWMGIPKSETNPDGVAATVENYMQQHITYTENGIEKELYLYDAVRCFRFMNPDVTSLYSPNIRFGQNPLYQNIPAFTPRMLEYMRSLANPADGSKPQLYIHTKIVDVQISEENVFTENYLGDNIKYVKFVAIPIEANMNEAAKDFVYICAEPQPFKVRVGDHAPHMQVGFSEKHYPASLGTLSVRISKSQFEKLVDHGDGNYKELHIPLRDINVVTPSCVGVKTPDPTDTDNDNLRYVRIANSTDALMEQYIMENMIVDENNVWPPAVGTVDYLVGKHDDFWPTPAGYEYPNEQRMLKMHFSKDFQVREGYSYRLRYYYIEDLNQGFNFTCNGNADIIIKIVPDYEVWTGGADNTDWSNDENWRRADYDELYADNGTTLKNNYLPNGKVGDDFEDTNFVTDEDRERMQGFAPLYCTNILMMTSENMGDVTTTTPIPDTDPVQYQTETTFKVKPASWLYDDGPEKDSDGNLTGFPALRSTSSPLIRYDFQAHEWDSETMADQLAEAKVSAGFRADGDMITELYSTNVCDNIAFQSETELVNAHLLNYSKAWVEFALPKNLWHLVSSPLQATLSGEWYAPTWSGRQETTYYEPITFDETHNHMAMKGISGNYPAGLGYDRFAPAVYQRQWDKAKAVLYERGAVWSADDASQTENLGEGAQGDWSGSGAGFSWENANADDYLNRLVYKPFGDSKINVAVRGSWSGAHNDHTVPYDNGGFSVMPINNLKDHNDEAVKTIFRLPKDDQYYDIWDWTKGYVLDRRVRVYIKDDRRPWPPTGVSWADSVTAANTVTLNNRGRLRSDYFSTDTTAVYQVKLNNEGSGSLGYFLACNPFICGLDMQSFFALNSDKIQPYYLVLRDSDIDPNDDDNSLTTTHLGSTWKWTDMNLAGIQTGDNSFAGNTVVPPRYAFFIKSKNEKDTTITLKFNKDMMVHTPRTVPAGTTTGGGSRLWMTISAKRDGNSSEARVIRSANASNKFLPEEDLETFIVSDISSNIPVVYTLTGRLATSINRIHDFMVLPIGIESNSDEPATVTFQGVEMLGDSLMLFDAKTGEAVPLHSGFTTRMPGRTQNRFFIIQGSNLKEAIAESNLQIYGEDGIIVVASTTGQPITEVHVYDTGGRQVYVATPNSVEHRFRLPNSVYVVKANTEETQQVRKVMTK